MTTEEAVRIVREVISLRAAYGPGFPCEINLSSARRSALQTVLAALEGMRAEIETVVGELVALMAERDEARAEWDKADNLARKRGELLGEARAEIERLEVIVRADNVRQDVLVSERNTAERERDEARAERSGLAAVIAAWPKYRYDLPIGADSDQETIRQLEADLAAERKASMATAASWQAERERSERLRELLERCETVVIGYDTLHGEETSPLVQEIRAALAPEVKP